MENHRRQYRSRPEQDLDLDVDVVGTRNRLHPATILDVSGGGMRLLLAKPMQPAPGLGNVLHVVLRSQLFEEPINAPVVVVQSDQTDEGQEIGVSFLDWLGLAAVIPAQFADLFNLRADPRLEFDPATPVEVTIRGLDIMFELQGVLHDISRGGLSFNAAPVAECALGRTDLCALEFSLPGSNRTFSVAGRIRHRGLCGETVQYGVCFDPAYTQQFHDQLQVIEDYVQKRMRAALRDLMPQ